jgi:hypothetical protein
MRRIMAAGSGNLMGRSTRVVRDCAPALAGSVLLMAALFSHGCEKKETLLSPSISVSGTVANNSGYTGTIVVEIEHNLRDIADSEGHYSIGIHQDFYIDSLYAWVDRDGNGLYTQGEPFGFYYSTAEPHQAKAIHARDADIGNVDFSIP